MSPHDGIRSRNHALGWRKARCSRVASNTGENILSCRFADERRFDIEPHPRAPWVAWHSLSDSPAQRCSTICPRCGDATGTWLAIAAPGIDRRTQQIMASNSFRRRSKTSSCLPLLACHSQQLWKRHCGRGSQRLTKTTRKKWRSTPGLRRTAAIPSCPRGNPHSDTLGSRVRLHDQQRFPRSLRQLKVQRRSRVYRQQWPRRHHQGASPEELLVCVATQPDVARA